MSICACKHRALGPVHVSIHLYTRYPDTHTLKHTNFEYYTHSFPQREIWSYPNLHLIYIYPSDITTHTHTHHKCDNVPFYTNIHHAIAQAYINCKYCLVLCENLTVPKQNVIIFCLEAVMKQEHERKILLKPGHCSHGQFVHHQRLSAKVALFQ